MKETSTDAGSAPHLLPEDVDSPQFSEGLRLLKKNYPDRTSFNHFVCEELARRGIAPNGANVLKYGRWGQGVAVAADVRSWFAHLARRLSARHANIPDVCQQQFNALGEQFWALALEHVGSPLKEELMRLQETTAQETAAWQARLEAITTARDVAEQRFQARIFEKSEQIEALERRLQLAIESTDQVRTELRLTHGRVTAAELALGNARQDFESRIRTLDAASQADKTAREQAHLEAVALLTTANERLQAQLDQVRRDAASQIDKARQDARAAEDRARQEQNRADIARSDSESFREQLSNERVAHARTQRDFETIQTQYAQSQANAAQMHAALQVAQEAAKSVLAETLFDLAQSAAEAGIELRVPPGANRPGWIDERTWMAFTALANVSLSSSKPGKAP